VYNRLKNLSTHPIIHSSYFYSASSSLLLLRGAPDTTRILCRSFTPKRRVKNLPQVPTWRIERDSIPRFFGRKATNLSMSYHAPTNVSHPLFFPTWLLSGIFPIYPYHIRQNIKYIWKWILLDNFDKSLYYRKSRYSPSQIIHIMKSEEFNYIGLLAIFRIDPNVLFIMVSYQTFLIYPYFG